MREPEGGLQLAVELEIVVPELPHDQPQALVDAADRALRLLHIPDGLAVHPQDGLVHVRSTARDETVNAWKSAVAIDSTASRGVSLIRHEMRREDANHCHDR